jgi:hypothetical protein
MLIENALADAVRFFHIDALSSSVGLKVDFDMALLVLASGLYRLMANRMRGYQDAQARQIFRDLIDMPADISISQAKSRFASTAAPTSRSFLLPTSATNRLRFHGGRDSSSDLSNRRRPPASVRLIAVRGNPG